MLYLGEGRLGVGPSDSPLLFILREAMKEEER